MLADSVFAFDLCKSQPVHVLPVDTLARLRRIIIVGDLHGDAWSLSRILRRFDERTDLLLFLGDYADRGEQSVEVVERIYHLLVRYPQSVLALQGNHEVYSTSGEPQFGPCHLIEDARNKWGTWERFFDAVYAPFVAQLYLAVLIPGEILFVHGGVSSRIVDLQSLLHPSRELAVDILNSEATNHNLDERPNSIRGAGVRFGIDTTRSVCDKLGVKRIFRGHQHELARSQPGVMHDRRLVTVVTGRTYAKKPYVVSLNSEDLESGSILSLRDNQEKRFDLKELSQLSLHAEIRLLPKAKQQGDIAKATENLTKRLRTKVLPPTAALSDWPGLPDPAIGAQFYRFTLDELLNDTAPKITSQVILVAMVDVRAKTLLELFFSNRGLTPGSFQQVEL